MAVVAKSSEFRRELEMLDYLKWTQRARAFIRGLAGLPGRIRLDDSVESPGKDDAERRAWLHSRMCSLPPDARQFVESASQWCIFQYRWSPPRVWLQSLQALLPGCEMVSGGADLCEANRYYLYDGRDQFQAMFKSLPVPAGFAEHLGFTKSRGRFLRLAGLGGDRELVLELDSADGVRGVGCVSSAAPTSFQRFSDSFDSFLKDWERICYITPEPEMLAPWLDQATGLLHVEPDKADELRTIFFRAAST
jgi:hypothetical protein